MANSPTSFWKKSFQAFSKSLSKRYQGRPPLESKNFAQAFEKGLTKYMMYKGPSMNPTLKTGDMLCVVPYNGRKIRRGDVVVFLAPDSGRSITHRVISVDSRGIRTLGDNNNQADRHILDHDDLVGRVVYALRGKRRVRIYNGLTGQLFAAAVRATRAIRLRLLNLLLRPLYHHLARSGVLRRYIFPRMKTRILSFERTGGTERQLLMGQRVIGRCRPGSSQWWIKPPFRLFVDAASLPGGDQDC